MKACDEINSDDATWADQWYAISLIMLNSSKPISLKAILTRSRFGTSPKTVLNEIVERNRFLLSLKRAIPSFLRDHCSCVLSGRTMYVYASSSVWASQLRFHSRLIEHQFCRLLPVHGISKVKIRVVPEIAEPKRIPRANKTPSRQAIQTLKVSAEGITNLELSESLRRLADTLERKSKLKSS